MLFLFKLIKLTCIRKSNCAILQYFTSPNMKYSIVILLNVYSVTEQGILYALSNVFCVLVHS